MHLSNTHSRSGAVADNCQSTQREPRQLLVSTEVIAQEKFNVQRAPSYFRKLHKNQIKFF